MRFSADQWEAILVAVELRIQDLNLNAPKIGLCADQLAALIKCAALIRIHLKLQVAA